MYAVRLCAANASQHSSRKPGKDRRFLHGPGLLARDTRNIFYSGLSVCLSIKKLQILFQRLKSSLI